MKENLRLESQNLRKAEKALPFGRSRPGGVLKRNGNRVKGVWNVANVLQSRSLQKKTLTASTVRLAVKARMVQRVRADPAF
jgi:hypothetical protein